MKERMTSRHAPFRVDLKAHIKYMFCACGKSENQPFCDQWSHKRTSITPILFTVEKDGAYFICGCKKTKSPPYCDTTHKKL
jgi:CDGSH iron-sulfur domain-containing protein 3